MKHGKSCEKVEHGDEYIYLHDSRHDGVYWNGGVRRCGRCHAFLTGADTIEEDTAIELTDYELDRLDEVTRIYSHGWVLTLENLIRAYKQLRGRKQ